MIWSSSGRLLLSAIPRKRPQWNGTAPPPCGMISLSVGKSLKRSDKISCMKAMVSALRAHAGRPRREDRDVGAALALQLELGAFHALADLVIAHLQRRFRGHRRLVLDRFGLVLAK